MYNQGSRPKDTRNRRPRAAGGQRPPRKLMSIRIIWLKQSDVGLWPPPTLTAVPLSGHGSHAAEPLRVSALPVRRTGRRKPLALACRARCVSLRGGCIAPPLPPFVPRSLRSRPCGGRSRGGAASLKPPPWRWRASLAFKKRQCGCGRTARGRTTTRNHRHDTRL